MRFIAVAVVATALVPGLAGAETDCGGKAELRTYYQEPARINPTDGSRCDFSGLTCTVALKGWLFVPPGPSRVSTAGAPMIIHNHGSEETPGAKCEIGEHFSGLGYVVFVPHRRGHGRSTGQYLEEYCAGAADAGQCKMDYLHLQVADVKAAVDYTKSLRIHRGTLQVEEPRFRQTGDVILEPARPNLLNLIDPTRVALMGHSFGGITVVFANEQRLGQQVVVDIAGGSQSWEGNETARSEMRKAVRNGTSPIFFLEPMNDKSIEPTFMLATTAARACRQFQAAIYGPVDATGDGIINDADYVTDPDPTDDVTIGRDVAHGKFVSEHVATWAPAAHEFMQRYFQKPAAPFDNKCDGTSSVPDTQ